ncbi:MAG: 3'(2'),5'-bisphosphate nucleotidase CysQ [Bacteroidales bacterium]|nr:3'(2'),5'-bisphosphate nucleotidase CysQ [Bacteroidales bacterium]MBN2755660.1 3'(2'),5'-bisphosphate nucleotidase CysQ [Bacteroidales bacterium]
MNDKLLNIAILAAVKAGKEILNIYKSDNFELNFKQDNSPLTIADKKAHEIIKDTLIKTNIPLLSEEGSKIDFEKRRNWNYLWIVDPLDGTKEFVKKNGEFTVNIALIFNNEVVMGVVYSPCLKKLYFNQIDGNAFLTNNIDVDFKENELLKFIFENKEQLPKQRNKSLKVVASRSHLSKETKEYIDNLKSQYNDIEIVNIGSSLKLCLIAEASADIYPRFAPTMEWDTAAGHAIINAAGGNILNSKTNEELLYNKENLLNPWFIAKMKTTDLSS